MNQDRQQNRQSGSTSQQRATEKQQAGSGGELHPGQEGKMDVVEEQLEVGKREVEKGGVRVRKTVEEKPVEEQVTLREEHLNVERRPVDRPATVGDEAFREGVVEVTERAERPVVQKEARVIEEVVVGKDIEQRTETVRDTVRRTDVQVEQIPTSGKTTAGSSSSTARSFDTFDADYRTNFQSSFPGGEYTYDQVQPAYRYGYDWASRGDTKDWESAELEARRHWEARNPGTWDRFKTAARYAYESARQKVAGR